MVENLKKYQKKNIDFKKLSAHERIEVINVVYPLFSKRVAGWSFYRFKHELFNTKNKYKIKIQLIYNREFKLIGFLYMSVLKITVKTEEIITQFYLVIDSEYTKNNLATSFCIKEVMKLKLTNFFSTLYVVDLVLSPIVYYQIAKYFPTVFPRPHTSPQNLEYFRKIIHHVYKKNNVKLKVTDDFVGSTDEKIKLSIHELEKLNKLSNKYTRFFIEKTKLDGKGLIIVLPLTAVSLLKGIYRFLHHKIRKKIT